MIYQGSLQADPGTIGASPHSTKSSVQDDLYTSVAFNMGGVPPLAGTMLVRLMFIGNMIEVNGSNA